MNATARHQATRTIAGWGADARRARGSGASTTSSAIFAPRPLFDRDGALDDEAYAFDGYAAADSYAEETAERAAELRPAAPAIYAMSDRQRSYLADLIRTRGDELHRALDLDDVDRIAASTLIDELKSRPAVVPLRTLDARPAAPAPEPLPTVADGRYAIELDGAVRFFRLNTHAASGRQYLDSQASDDFHSITTYATKLRVLTAIAAEPVDAMRRYGVELGRCGSCGRTLTDETSRAFGIGPDCRAKIGGGA